MGPTACWSRILLASILSTDLLHILPPALLTSILKLSFVLLATRAVSAFYSLLFTQLPAWECLRIFLQEQDKAAPGRTTPLSPTPHSSLTSFIDKRVLLHFSVGGSLHYKQEWLNIYFRGREYLGFLDIFFPKILRQEKESWKVECIVMGSRRCWEAGMLPGWVGALRAVVGPGETALVSLIS